MMVSFAVSLAAVALLDTGLPTARPVLSLDGEWQFRLDPQDAGDRAGWADGEVDFADRIQVPGAWDAQGFGEPTDKLHHNHIGKAWYRRTLSIPEAWSGRRVFLCVGGVHRYADVYVNGQHLGEHIGYLSPFEFEIGSPVTPGSEATIALRVDSRQRWEVDALTGCVDIIDAMFTEWGGIWGHVWLEARGPAWARDLHVRTTVQPTRVDCDMQLAGTPGGADACRLQIVDAAGQVAATQQTGLEADQQSVHFQVDMPDARLWSPDEPILYTARVVLLKDGKPVDETDTRFGIRQITTEGWHFLLNSKRFFLRGYGDDAVYPETMAPPCDKGFYVKRLKLIKSYGFNYVRHHSHMLPPEYYDAADEVGMCVSAEFPIAYEQYYAKAKGPALDLYRSEWAAAIRRLRNHPSIFDWSMSNEMWGGFPLAAELYAIAKELDSLRLVIDSDGLPPAGFLRGTTDRPTLDFYAVQLNPHALPLDQPDKHVVPGEPLKPVICHETGNYTTFPRLSVAEAFTHNFKPFWLTPIGPKLERLGLLGEADRWASQSQKLYLLAHKMNLEDLRKNPRISGYQWWLFQEYWTGTNGLVDHYFQPKGITPEQVRPFNNDVVVLQDGLAANLRGGRPVRIRLLLSNYAAEPLRDAVLSWTVQVDGAPAATGSLPASEVGQGELASIGEVVIQVPDVDAPRSMKLHVELSAKSLRRSNTWSARVYPAQIDPPRTVIPIFASPQWAEDLKSFGAGPIPREEPLTADAVYVVGEPDLRTLDAAARGACLVCLNPDLVLRATANRFKPAWWLGGQHDSNLGTVVYDHPLTRSVAPDGWCDAGWYSLIEDSRAYILDDYPAAPQVLVRAIDLHTLCRSKALLYQARLGAGCVMVCGLNWRFGDGQDRPERDWLLTALLAHAAGRPAASAEMPVAWLRQQIESAGLPTGPVLDGFARLVVAAEQEAAYMNHRGGTGPLYICRQTQPGNAVEWETAPAGPLASADPVCFEFAGGLGYASQPTTAGFVLAVNRRELIRFDLARERHTWHSEDGRCRLLFLPRKGNAEDTMGIFYLELSPDLVAPGRPCLISVLSKGSDSRRWFGLTP